MKRTVIGIFAHVDAGKTTLSEAMLYSAGSIRSAGRVDHGNAFLDNFTVERQRGITIFSKQAIFQLKDIKVTLIDTPGHVDLSAEMERTIDILDCAILVINGSAGIQSHTYTLWKLLQRKNIPIFVFVNKMDLPDTNREKILRKMNKTLGGVFFDYLSPDFESIALCDEHFLEEYLETDCLSLRTLHQAIQGCRAFPCWFGSALKLDGVQEFMQGLAQHVPVCKGKSEFAAKVFKISHDSQGARMTHMKITGGMLHIRDLVKGEDWAEKVTQIRLYSGAKYVTVETAEAGDIVAVYGMSRTFPGLGIGTEPPGLLPPLEPVFTYGLIFPEGYDPYKTMQQLRELEEEEPQLHLSWDEKLQQYQMQIMGPVQIEILKQVLQERYGLDVSFGRGKVTYKETIASTVEGVGHYEPLRHYAEVHLVLEPGDPGSGVCVFADCPKDSLDRNWQGLILTHLMEKQHLGVLTGSPVTDIRITLTAGRAHAKHTEGGDFREATYRAVRQGLMQAESILLEPWYHFRIELPSNNVGRAMADLQRMGAEVCPPETEAESCVLTGEVPVSAFKTYPSEVAAYTHGRGSVICVPNGYRPCKEQDAAVAQIGYDPEADVANTPDSVFCSQGAGHIVKWFEVFQYMHIANTLVLPYEPEELQKQTERYINLVASDAELMAIFERTYGPIKEKARAVHLVRKTETEEKPRPTRKRSNTKQEFILVDGYNIIFAWEDLKKIAQENLEAARAQLIERLRNYQGFRRCAVIVVFDAYKVKGNLGSVEQWGDFSIVYTKEAETADTYIEKATYDLAKEHFVRVATSDHMEQLIILGSGALRISASAFEEEVKTVESAIRAFLKEFNKKQTV